MFKSNTFKKKFARRFWLFLEVGQILGWPNFWRPFDLYWPTYTLKLKINICVP